MPYPGGLEKKMCEEGGCDQLSGILGGDKQSKLPIGLGQDGS